MEIPVWCHQSDSPSPEQPIGSEPILNANPPSTELCQSFRTSHLCLTVLNSHWTLGLKCEPCHKCVNGWIRSNSKAHWKKALYKWTISYLLHSSLHLESYAFSKYTKTQCNYLWPFLYFTQSKYCISCTLYTHESVLLFTSALSLPFTTLSHIFIV